MRATAAASSASSDVFVTCSPTRTPPARAGPSAAASDSRTAVANARTTTPEASPYGPESPVLMSMSQRAVQLGIEVTWASSPKRRSSSPLVDRPAVAGGSASPNATDLLRRRSIKHRQIFKPQRNLVHSHQQQHHQHLAHCSKKGIHKFNEELMKLAPKRTNSLVDLTAESAADSHGMSRAQSVESTGSSSTAKTTTSVHQMQSAPVSISFGTPVRMPSVTPPPYPASKRIDGEAPDQFTDFMSTSMQNEFLDNSELDMELFQSSQDAETLFHQQRQQQQQQPPPIETPANTAKQPPASSARHIYGDVALLENDSIDEYLTSKELDAYITQSQSVVRAPSPKRPLERHKSMPFAQQSLLSASDEDLLAMMDETDIEGHLSAFGVATATAAAAGPNANGSRSSSSTVMGRHNSMPVASLGSGSGRTPRRQMRVYVPPPMEQSITIHSGSSQSEDD